MYNFDADFVTKFGVICGADEAGRGPLAGDVYAAAVILDYKNPIVGINDSKKLTEKRRELLFNEITSKAVSYCIATATVAEIEEINILNAAMLAMKRAIEGLKLTPEFALIDGNKCPKLGIPSESIIKGDGTSACIAAASILAKVARDRYMADLSELYPEYLFEQHKGYGTKLHYEKLAEYGASPVHRKSFLKKFYGKDTQNNG